MVRTCAVVGTVMAAAVRRIRGSCTPSDGSEGINRSRTAARSTDRTFATRRRMVVAARPSACIVATHDSICDRRSWPNPTSPNGTVPRCQVYGLAGPRGPRHLTGRPGPVEVGEGDGRGRWGNVDAGVFRALHGAQEPLCVGLAIERAGAACAGVSLAPTGDPPRRAARLVPFRHMPHAPIVPRLGLRRGLAVRRTAPATKRPATRATGTNPGRHELTVCDACAGQMGCEVV
jgi:hypothetical protein